MQFHVLLVGWERAGQETERLKGYEESLREWLGQSIIRAVHESFVTAG